MRILTAGHAIDLDRFEIDGPAGPVPVEPQVFAVIAALLRNRDRVVTKEELLDQVWGSRFVSESALTSRVKAARRALGDDGTAQAVIATVRFRGYKWVAPAAVADRPSGEPNGAVATTVRDLLEPILGRDDELADVLELMDRTRVVTLVGVGGVGKTRLALEVLRQRPGCLVELAPVRDPDAAAAAVASAIDVQPGQRADVAAACIEYLTGQRRLLVVDNCEHVLAAAADFLCKLLVGCPELSLLCTSRQPLGLPDEHVVELGPLPVPADGAAIDDVAAAPAVELFVTRARRALHSFRLDDRVLAKAGSLCRALDGLPLAIELAAGRSAALGLDDVYARLDRRLDLLSDDRPTAQSRHRSLRATLAWSYELLDADSKRLFRYLSAFPGGFSLATAEGLAEALDLRADPAAIVARLVQASMLTRTSTPSGVRFTQLETVRTFGVDELVQRGEWDAAHDLLVGWALELAEATHFAIHTPDEPLWDDRVRRELPNLRAARRHLTDRGRLLELAHMLRGLDEWALWRDVFEIWAWEAELVDNADPGDAELRQAALAVAVTSSFLRGRRDLAARYVEELLAGNPTGWPLAQALHMAANVSLFEGRPREAVQYWLRRRDLPECPERRPESTAWAANAAGYLRDFPLARKLAAEARTEAEASGSPTDRARAAYAIGEIEYTAGSGQERPWLEQAMELASAAGSRFIGGVAGVTLAGSRAAAGDVSGAAQLYDELIGRWLRTGTWTQQWTTLRNAVELLVGVDDDLCVQVWAAAHADPVAAALDETALARETRLHATLVDRLGEVAVGELERAGRAAERADLAHRTAAALRGLADG
ncbi:winged helix-turn-helix domain-containing protein [Mycobacterium sp. Y57]|uniref:ATP-binding protein n=1 Tax=Mycolicibacterium xanthum TaxID=2796469 RepID=UPI001C864C10|nr:winged helix-turn-helix domain-containing protein [Mycolicibacterium xanthum]MBX7435100.1 winged helix-turn-helix domain-containing protein [Mycolicibacterium xanthum]